MGWIITTENICMPSLGCFTKKCFLMKKLAQPALQVFGGCFDFDFEFDKFVGVHKSFPF